MRHWTTVIAILLFALPSSAQREVDWEVADIVEPDVMRSTTLGTEFSLVAALRNNGPDIVIPGDTLYYQIAILNSFDELLVQIPRGWYYTFINDTIVPGDTLFFWAGEHRMNTYPKSSTKLKVRFTSEVYNYGSENRMSDDTLLMNNTLTVEKEWLNPEGSQVSISDLGKDRSIDVAPNPASDKINISWLINSSLSNTARIDIMDMTGRTVLSREVDSRLSSIPLEIEQLELGFYTIHVLTGQLHFTEKLVVGH